MRDDRLGRRAGDLRLQRTRTVWLDEPIDDDVANVAMAKISFFSISIGRRRSDSC